MKKTKSEIEGEIKSLESLLDSPDVPETAKKDARATIEKLQNELEAPEEKEEKESGKKSHKKAAASKEKGERKKRKSHKKKIKEDKPHTHKKRGRQKHHPAEKPAEKKETHHTHHAPAKKKLTKKFERKEYKHHTSPEKTVSQKLAELDRLVRELPHQINQLAKEAREEAMHEFREKLEKRGIVLTKKFAEGGEVAKNNDDFLSILFGVNYPVWCKKKRV